MKEAGNRCRASRVEKSEESAASLLTPRASRHQRSRGQALVPVLLVLFILTAFAVTMSLTARREIRSAGSYLRETQQYYVAQGAVNYAAAQLQEVTGGGMISPELTLPPDTDANGWTQLGDGWYKIEIIDTASRVNINTADTATLARLPAFQADPGLAAAVVDWRDADDNPTTLEGASGAETDYYESLPTPYAAKNKPFDTVEELLLVRGITPAQLYGPGGAMGGASTEATTGMAGRAARSRQTGGNNPPGGGTNPPGGSGEPAGESGPPVDTSGSVMPLSELITTYSKERNVAGDGTARVNVKTASAADLQSKLGISRNLAQRLVDYRTNNQLNSIADLLNVPGFNRTQMQEIGDRVTTSDAEYRVGVLNINTAPAEALAALPGVDQAVYNAVIEAREGGTIFNGLNDIFRLTNLNRTQLQALLDHVCTKSSVYLVRVKVRMQGSPRIFAAQALVELAAPAAETGTGDAAAGTGTTAATQSESQVPRILQWREVPRAPGWSNWTTTR